MNNHINHSKFGNREKQTEGGRRGANILVRARVEQLLVGSSNSDLLLKYCETPSMRF